jgi:hypothetical protein
MTAREGRGAAALVAVEGDAAAYGVPPRTVHRFLVLPWIAAAVAASTALYRPVFRFLMREDGVVEWAQVLCILAATVVAAKVALHLYREGDVLFAGLWLAFAGGCFFIAGEEIAWGQRLLDVDTPEALSEINHQDDLTAHNIRGVQDAVNLVFTAAGLFGSVGAAFIRRRLRPERGSMLDLLTPPLFLLSLFVIVAGYKSARLLYFHEARFLVVKYGEYTEACLAAAFLAFGWYMLRWLRSADVGTHYGDDHPARSAGGPPRRWQEH